jgi:hypothetical protein
MPPKPPFRKQPTSLELRDDLLDFLQRKFYAGHAVNFAKDQPRLLKWVVLWPAAWLVGRGVTVTEQKYREIFMSVFMDALRFGDATKVTYLPAYLRQIIQSHFRMHGDEIYAAAKSMRNLTENALLLAGKPSATDRDPVAELAAASRLLKARKKTVTAPLTGQLSMF